MALKLIKSTAKNAKGGFIPKWYGVYRDGATVKTVSLGVAMRGNPPASGYLGDKGDEVFERSRNAAQAKLDELLDKAHTKGEAIRETATIIHMKTGKRFKDPALADLGDLYVERLGNRSPGHEASIRSGFADFAAFAARPVHGVKKAHTLGQVTRELAVAYFRHAAAALSFSTVKRYSHRLAHVYALVFPGADNPFAGARLAAVGSVVHEDENGEKARIETAVHHRPLDRAQLRKLYAASQASPLLHALAVTAASTGLRISDVCLLKWADVDLDPKNPVIYLKTAKTGSTVAVPIFDYAPSSPDYEPELGEFKRVLEAALADREDGAIYVFPEAADLYKQCKKVDEDGTPLPRAKWTFPGRCVIYGRGKALFARALFADEPEDAELAADGDETNDLTADEILEAIAAADWPDERKKRVSEIYRRHADGEGYRAIRAATGCAKSTISYDLGAVERLVGKRVKVRPASGQSVRELMRLTRQERASGKRCASIYSWHSLRGSFVVLMRDNGVPLETIRELVGHETTDMTLQYYNPTQKMAAETARRILTRRNAAQAALEAAQTRPAITAAQLPATRRNAPNGRFEALREALASLAPEDRALLLASVQ